ncbi:MAG: c-type cytochrome, partial [Planctomycetaceae bacterium]
EGTKVPYTGVGGVFRIRPDGSNFRVVARGLRNSCGIAFDNQWNLFTNDNDHEGSPHAYVPGKLLYVTPHSDFSWPRGWMPTITPDRADLLEPIFNGMGRAVPVGQSYYDDDYLGAKFRNNLLVARWCIRAVTRYPLKSRGASFKADEEMLITGENQARPVGVSVGRGGRIFATVSYMAHNEGSPVYASDLVMLTKGGDTLSAEFPAYDATTADAETLYLELSDPSWERRRRAHLEILRRGGQTVAEAGGRLESSRLDHPALTHLIWLTAAHISEKGTSASDRALWRGLFATLMKSKQPLIRLQIVRAMHEYAPVDESNRILWSRALSDPDARVRHAALIALFDAPAPLNWKEIAQQAESDDRYVRQTASLLLAERAPHDVIEHLCDDPRPNARLAGVLAAGFKLTMPAVNEPIPEPLPLAPWREEAVYQVTYADQKVDLRDNGRIGLFTVAEHWKAGKHSDEQEALFEKLKQRLDDSNEPVRLQAAHFLYLLNDARTEPAIARLRSATERKRLSTAPLVAFNKAWVIGPFPDAKQGLKQPHPPEQGAIDPSATFTVSSGEKSWESVKVERMLDFRKLLGDCSDASCYAYFRIESPRKQQMMLLPGSDDGIRIWQNGKVVWEKEGVRAALPLQDMAFVDLEPGSNDFLFRVNNLEGESALYVHYRTLSEVSAVLPDKIGASDLAARLKAAASDPGSSQVPAEFLAVDWTKAAADGDVARGRKIFSAEGIGCAKCHAIDANSAGQGGPSLAGAKARFTVPYLVESMLLPNKMISPVFKATQIVTKEGKTLIGLVVGETGEKVELLLNDATRASIAKSEIEERKLQETSPMPAGLLKKPEELRDLLAYLLSVQ